MRTILLLAVLSSGLAILAVVYGTAHKASETTDLNPEIKTSPEETLSEPKEPSKSDSVLITLETPQPDALISSPLTIRGEARGVWFFEATFPIILVDWDGRIIAEGYAQATENWMTEEFVPFEGTISFTSPYENDMPNFMQRGALILQKSNPSGLPEHDDALEIWVQFKPEDPTTF